MSGDRDTYEVGHGVDVVVLTVRDETSQKIVALTPAAAERLGVALIRQARHARMLKDAAGETS